MLDQAITIPELESEKKDRNGSSYAELIRQVNTYNPDWTTNLELQDRQKKILNELPVLSQLAEQLVDGIKKDRKDQELHAKFKKKEAIFEDLHQHTRSLLFEKLVQIEKDLFFSKEEPISSVSDTTRWADTNKESAITEVLKHPPFPQLIRSRKVDLVGIQAREKDDIGEVDQGIFVITSAYEVKSGGTLDYRAFRQMKGGELKTIEENMAEFAKAINALSSGEAQKLGLDGLGRKGKKIMVLRKLRQHIVMPRNVNLQNMDRLINKYGHPDKPESFSSEELIEFQKMLSGKHPDTNIILHNSSISSKELDKLRDQVLPLVRSILEKQ